MTNDPRGELLLALARAESLVEALDDLALRFNEDTDGRAQVAEMHATAIDVWRYLHDLAGEED